MDFFDTNSLILGILAICLFAECVVLVVRMASLKNKMEGESEKVRAEERVKYEKMRNDLELEMKEREIELKSEYETLMSSARDSKKAQEEFLERAKDELKNAEESARHAKSEFERFKLYQLKYEALVSEYAEKLSRLAGEDIEALKKDLKAEVARACESELSGYRNGILLRGSRAAEERAQAILLETMQRITPLIPASATCAIVQIPDEAMKGRLIGKEGRNIRAFEAETATTLVIDDTPNSVMVSSFNPSRRAVARLALEALLSDGRINPASIEAAVAKAKQDVVYLAQKAGEEAAEALGIRNISPEVLDLLGRLGFHLSLNQDTLLHSLETAKFAGIVATELGFDPRLAKRAGLFHDIGKAMYDSELSHARAGAELLRALGESWEVVNAVEAHHGEVPSESIYAEIVKLADSISASRAGARMEAAEGYIKRVADLERAAMSFEGVSSAYALQAGRELRVFVSPDVVDDAAAFALTGRICSRIEEICGGTVPVKVTLIRERRFTDTANSRKAVLN